MARLLFAALILIFLVAGGVAFAAEKLPPVKYEKFELPNGLDVILYEDHRLPNITVNTWYHVGSKNEKRGRTGFAHLFEHLMFEGSQHHPEDFRLAEFGGDYNGSTSEDRTNYLEIFPSNYLEYVLWMESDRMGFLLPAMTQEGLDTQRDVVKNERRERYDNQPYAKSYELLLSGIYPVNHPYSWSVIGSMEDLSAASLEDVKDFFRMYYAPNNASLCIAGDFDPVKAKSLVEKYYGSIPSGPPIDRLEAWTPQLNGVKRQVAEDRVSLPKLYMAWPSPAQYAPGDAELNLLGDILSKGRNSRLYKTLVYEKQIAQDVSAYHDINELCSKFMIEITAREGHTLEEIEREVEAVLRDVLEKGVTNEELARAQATTETDFVRAMERLEGFGGVADRLNAYNTWFGEPDRFQWDLYRFARVTPADVNRYAREVLDLDRRFVLHIVPQGDLTATTEEPNRATPPGPAAEASFSPPSIQRLALGNGATLLLVEKHELPLVQVNLVLSGGWANDPLDKPGSASLTAELLDEGTESRTSLEIGQEAQRLGARLSTGSGWDGSNVNLNVLKSRLDPALALMADMVMNPTFPAEELERQRQNYLGRIAKESRQPLTVALKTYYRVLYGAQHPYASPFTGSGTEKSIRDITRDDLVNYYRVNYLPNNAAFVVVGDISLTEAKSKIEKAFSGWKSGSAVNQEIATPQAPRSTHVYIVDKPKAAQSAIVVGHLGLKRTDPDFTPTEVLVNALGGGSYGRLYRNIREDKGYTYGAYSFVPARKGVAPFASYAEVQTEVTDKAVAEFVKEIRDIGGSRPLSQAEVLASRDNLVKSFPQEFVTMGGIAGKLNTLYLQGLPLDEWSSYPGRVGAVSGDVVTRMAQTHFHPDALLIVIVGDREKIEPGLRQLGIGEVSVVDPAEL